MVQNGPGTVKAADKAARTVRSGTEPGRHGRHVPAGRVARRAARPAAARGLQRINVTVRAVWARRPDGPGDGDGAAGGEEQPAPKRARVA